MHTMYKLWAKERKETVVDQFQFIMMSAECTVFLTEIYFINSALFNKMTSDKKKPPLLPSLVGGLNKVYGHEKNEFYCLVLLY